ncbi:hypothetical protein LPB137_02290 [Poseidonibacter parvus]|uniref:OmpA-like domain-containing protein n=1 Tax=Poseidonibacter parvus TaxID=1850254 RepID=A0A1P8KJP3_9BACT|nr:OmpA family protein [Poseidonibacter parvus]APW64755.1 hypothetical protein LPB137_02290 [Poseidonibacter parvus]
MQIKKVVGLVLLSATLSFGSMASIFTGENVTKSEYKNGERGIIVKQDIDADGIIDSKDDCLETIPCKEEGCKEPEPKPVVIGDDDKDGVLNNIDECPNTPKGFEVDEVGCSKLVNLEVLFDRNKYNIKENFTQKLDIFVDFMKKHIEYKAEIQGHTDSRATEKYNEVLSENRASTIKTYLIESGIEEERLTSIGYGELSPIDTNKTKEGRANNRRVIAVLKK